MTKVTRIEPSVAELKPRKRVAAYARVSMESDRLNHSLSMQVSYYSNLIQKNPEWEYAGVYADSGISGTGTAKRLEFQRMLADCEAGKIDLVLTKSISRMARNVVDLLETVRHLKAIGIDVWFEKENIRSMSANGELMLSILAGYAEEESRTISDNIKWSIQKKFERGEQWHAAAFGYRWDGSTFVVQEEEADAIREVFDQFLRDVPMRRISQWLKSKGYTGTTTFVRYALQNEVYVGDVILQKYFRTSHLSHKALPNTGQLPRYYIRDNHSAIIDRETFEKVQEKIRTSYEFNPAAHRMVKPSCFSAKIICKFCGQHFVRDLSLINNNMEEKWMCYTKRKYGAKSCQARNLLGYRLREAIAELFGWEGFDEEAFGKRVDKILTTDRDTLEIYLTDGTVETVPIKYHHRYDRNINDPHGRFYGYRWHRGRYEVEPQEADAVRFMYDRYADGWSVTRISAELADQGYVNIKGRVNHELVSTILDSDFYIGHRRIRGQYTASGKYEFIKDDHEPLISEAVFAKVEKRRVAERERQMKRCETRRRMDSEKRNGDTRQPK